LIPRVLLDCDGPLGDFTGAYLAALYIESGENHEVKEVDRWAIHQCGFFQAAADRMKITRTELKKRVDHHVSKPGFCYAINPQPDAKAAVLELHTLADVWAVTSPWDSSQTWMHERHRWLQEHFAIARDQIIQVGKKHPIHGDVFVDDKPSNVVAWAAAWPLSTAVLFDMHHNQREPGDPSVLRAGWDDILNIVRRMASERSKG
jgi:5'(3')-deoxyribonucleotidase